MKDWTKAELKKLGRAIRTLRHERMLSQEDFAEIADIHRTYVTRIELGKANISWENISRIARAFRLKPSALLLRAGM